MLDIQKDAVEEGEGELQGWAFKQLKSTKLEEMALKTFQ